MSDEHSPCAGKVLFFANTDWYLYNFRLPLARALRERGHEVVLVCPPGRYAERLQAAGFRWVPFQLTRDGVNPVGELVTLLRLVALYRRERPQLVHHFTIKCVLYGGFAARLTGCTAVVAAITGIGHVFTSSSLRARVVRVIVSAAYRMVLGRHVIFQNADDLQEFVVRGLVSEDRCTLIGGSGIDIARFAPAPRTPGPPCVLMVARLLAEKGVAQFVEAARIVRAAVPQCRFLLAGDRDPGNPSSITGEQVSSWQSEGQVELLGHVEDVLPLLHAADLAVLPSVREGTPRSLLEAAACGLALVATDVPGCREVVKDGDNGLLVPVGDAAALAAAIRTLLEDPARRARMGARSRALACERFSEASVIERTVAVYQRALAGR
ncbi:MAG: glycosyltransferase family 4 protein [Deltaproteobacteria bacterium]|nr:glycosyltransferase family 4 protein [Deltaproteobacteria bacterium]